MREGYVIGSITTRLVDTVAAYAIVGTLVAVLCLAAVVEAGKRRAQAMWVRVVRAFGLDASRPAGSVARHMPYVWTGHGVGSAHLENPHVVALRQAPDSSGAAELVEEETLFI